jgi:hypothetical protein
MSLVGRVLRGLAATYLAGVWLLGVGIAAPRRLLPRPVTFFMDVAALFPDADDYVLEYRAQAWVCVEQRWAELDVRPYFSIDRENKESRFQRAMLLYQNDKPVLRALDAYVTSHHGEDGADDGIGPARRVGGVRLIALRIPLPRIGDPVRPFAWRPLAVYPDAQRHVRYQTPQAEIAERCDPARDGSPATHADSPPPAGAP